MRPNNDPMTEPFSYVLITYKKIINSSFFFLHGTDITVLLNFMFLTSKRFFNFNFIYNNYMFTRRNNVRCLVVILLLIVKNQLSEDVIYIIL